MMVTVSASAQSVPKVTDVSEHMKVYDWKITRVIDGDTIEVAAPWLPDPLNKKLSIRIFGVDTPEKGFRAKCDSEAHLDPERLCLLRSRDDATVIVGEHNDRATVQIWWTFTW